MEEPILHRFLGIVATRKILEKPRGFTLLELLVSIAVIAVLIGLVLGGLRHSRRSALTVKCLGHALACSRAITLYANDHKEYFPFFARPTWEVGAFENAGIPFSFFQQAGFWPMVAKQYMNDLPLDPSQLCPGNSIYKECFGGGAGPVAYLAKSPPGYVMFSSYTLMFGALADPKMWGMGGWSDDTSLMRPVRLSEVRYPSVKGMMIEPFAAHLKSGSWYLDPEVSMHTPEGRRNAFTTVFNDGHGASVPYRDFSDDWIRAEGMHPTDQGPVTSTRAGCLGRDIGGAIAATP